MATPEEQGVGRTFPNDPSPPTKAPAARAVAAAPAAAEPPGITTPDATVPTVEPTPAVGPKSVFRVVNTPEGGRDVFMLTDDLQNTRLGPVSAPDADEILNSVAEFNPLTKSWDVPEDIAQSLMQGKMGLADHVAARFRSGEAGVVLGLIGGQRLRGLMTVEDALSRGDIELLKMQVSESPGWAWSGGFGKVMAQNARHVLGKGAEILPFIGHAATTGAGGAAFAGAGALGAVAIAGGPLGTAASIAAVAAFMNTGAAFNAFRFTMEVEGGALALDLDRKGVDDKIVRTVAPLAGAVVGALELMGFKYLTAPLKRVMLTKVFGSAAMKKVLAKWYISYAKEIGMEVAVEDAQELVNIVAENLALIADDKPELLISGPEAYERLKQTTSDSLAAFMVIKVPGAALEARTAKAVVKADAELTKDVTTKLKQREAKQAAEVVVETPEGEKPAPPLPPAVQKADEKTAQAVDKFEAGEISDAQLVDQVSDLMEKADEPQPKTKKQAVVKAAKDVPPTPALTLEEKTRAVEVKARTKALQSDKSEIQTLINAFDAVRKDRQKNKRPTRLLDRQIGDLLTQELAIEAELEDLKEDQPVQIILPEAAKLEMEAATLEGIIETGFKEGRKEVIKKRAGEIKTIAKEEELTQTDVKNLLKNKNIGLLGDAAFRNFVKEFRAKAKARGVQKAELKKTREVLKEKQLVKEHNLRLINKFPALTKMTTEQLVKYREIVKAYDKGDEILTPKRVRALEKTKFKGAKTTADVRRMASLLTGRPLEDFKNVVLGQVDRNFYDSVLARTDATRGFLVEQTRMAQEKGAKLALAFNARVDALAAAAIASRRKLMTVGERLIDILVPQQRQVFEFIEEPNPIKRAQLGVLLTPEERDWADWHIIWHKEAEDYLVKVHELAPDNRFSGRYIFHSGRGAFELLRDLPGDSVSSTIENAKKTAKELIARWKGINKDISTKPAVMLGLRKHLKQLLFRTGELDPTKNLVAAEKQYAKDFYTKVAIDESFPAVEALITSVRALDKSPEADEITRGVMSFLKEFLNAKQGNVETTEYQRGGFVETTIRGLMAIASLRFIAGNYALQSVAPAGEFTAATVAIGIPAMVKAKFRKNLTAKGARIMDKYESYIGESPWSQLLQPGRGVGDNLNVLLYGIFQASRRMVTSDVLLGSMTDAEFEAETISDERLAGIKIQAGRWLDIHGSKSIRGSTALGAAATQFRGWAIPPLTTILGGLKDFAVDVGAGKKPLTTQQRWEFLRLLEVTAIAMVVLQFLTEEDEDDTFAGRMIMYIRREILTVVNVLDPRLFTGAPIALVMATDIGELLAQLLSWEKFKNKPGLKAVAGAGHFVTPSAIKPFLKKKKR